jgi:hypothetical protein
LIEHLTEAGQRMGTLAYMAPEQASGETVDARADIFSFGAMLYEMATGQRAFSGKTPAETLVGRDAESADAAEHAGCDAAARSRADDPPMSSQGSGEALPDDGGCTCRSRGDQGGLRFEPCHRGHACAARTASSIFVAIVVLLLAAGAAAVWWRNSRLSSQPASARSASTERPLTRLTTAPGLQTDVTLSPDGRLIAYASDQGGNFDIWVQPVTGGGDAVQITKSLAADTEPDWSPDGTQLVFRSERDGGGLFLVPALGGLERRLAPFGVGRNGRPMDRAFCFRWRRQGTTSASCSWSPRMVPRHDKYSSRSPTTAQVSAWAWHPDGRRVSLMAATVQRPDAAMYTVPLDGGQATITRLPESMRNVTGGEIGEFVWAPDGAAVYVELRVNFIWNIWKLDVDPKTLAAGALDRLSAGTGQDTRMVVARDGKRIAFTIKAESIRLWAYSSIPPAESSAVRRRR